MKKNYLSSNIITKKEEVNMKRDKTRNTCLAALFTAMITLFTVCFRFSIGTNSGYIHLGDSVIYLASCMLPAPYAVFSAAAGGMASDLLSGAGVWVIPTGIIKALNTVPFLLFRKNYMMIHKKDFNRILVSQSIIACVLSGIITSGGYFAAECLLYGVKPAIISFFPGLLQPIGSSVLFIVSASALDSAKIKSRFSYQ